MQLSLINDNLVVFLHGGLNIEYQERGQLWSRSFNFTADNAVCVSTSASITHRSYRSFISDVSRKLRRIWSSSVRCRTTPCFISRSHRSVDVPGSKLPTRPKPDDRASPISHRNTARMASIRAVFVSPCRFARERPGFPGRVGIGFAGGSFLRQHDEKGRRRSSPSITR